MSQTVSSPSSSYQHTLLQPSRYRTPHQQGPLASTPPAAPGINATEQQTAGLGLTLLLLAELGVTAPPSPCNSSSLVPAQQTPGSWLKGRGAPRRVKVTLPVWGGQCKHAESFYTTSASPITCIFLTLTFSPLKVLKALQNKQRKEHLTQG